jgi:CRP/FNR family transcriptional regulator
MTNSQPETPVTTPGSDGRPRWFGTHTQADVPRPAAESGPRGDEQMLLGRLDPGERVSVETHAVALRASINEVVFSPTQPTTSLMIVRRGVVREYIALADGRELTIRVVGPGGIVGEHALGSTPPQGLTAVAIDATELSALPAGSLRSAAKEMPTLAIGISELLQHRLDAAQQFATKLAYWPGERRLADLLLQLDAHHGHPTMSGHRIIGPAFTQVDLACMVGATRASVVRALASWRASGIVELRHRRVVILDIAGLQRAASEPQTDNAMFG